MLSKRDGKGKIAARRLDDAAHRPYHALRTQIMKTYRLSALLGLALFVAACGGGGKRSVDPGAYGRALHDRFYREWKPPASIASRRAELSVPVDVEITSRGEVASFVIARPSGNAAVDESINAIARRVKRVARPPGRATNEPFRLRINFELDVR